MPTPDGSKSLTRSDALTAQKHLDRPSRKPRVDLSPGVAMGDAVEVLLHHDVIVDANPPIAPLRQNVGLQRQRFQSRPIHRLKQLPPGLVDASDNAFVVQAAAELGDGRVQFGQAVELGMPKPAEQPMLGD
jgi:hypothetical protein